MIDWKTMTAGEAHHLEAKLGGSEYADGSGAMEIHFCAREFAAVDWIRVPSNFPGPEAGEQLRVTDRFRQQCPCCRVEMVHLHAGPVGVIECLTTKEFKFYRVEK